MVINEYQQGMMKSASKGFCYDANPSCWDNKHERKQMEILVTMGLMKKLKNHSGDKHGFYALTEKGKVAIAKCET